MTLSVVMVTYNSADIVEEALKNITGLWDEVLVGDGGSTDGTLTILKKYQKGKNGFRIKSGMTKKNLGERKQELVERAKGDWILVLDADERVSEELYQEIRRIASHHKIRLEHKNVMDPRLRGDDNKGGGDDNKQSEKDKNYFAYRIPYQNYVFEKPVYHGGERYAKVRLFRRGYGRISPEPLHEEVMLNRKTHKATPSKKLRGGLEDGNVGELRGVIHHHSYRSPWQLFTKFTRYAWVAAEREIASPRRLFLYGPHMFWARFVKEKGYKDGWRGLVLALAFGYMEGLTYWVAFIRQIFTRPPLAKAKGVAFKTS